MSAEQLPSPRQQCLVSRGLSPFRRLGLTSSLRRCLGTTNLIDNSHSALRERTRRVKRRQSGTMALRWAAASLDAATNLLRRSKPDNLNQIPSRIDTFH